ncbi:transposable element Tcb1 transposase [Trichonephila clavipes]|nr:transposable element Tcb1 transposase [Trichonephila clavipes]
MKEGCGRQNGMKLSLLTSHAFAATPRWSDSSLETPWREDAEQLRYAPPHWSCTEYYGIGRYWISLSHSSLRIAAATPDQLWQRVEAAWSAVPQEHIQSLFESMPRRVAAVICNNGGYSGY